MIQRNSISFQNPGQDPRFIKALRGLEEAVECQRLGRNEEADRLYAKLLKKNPDYFDALNLYGVFKYQQGHFHKALELFKKAIRINSRSINALNNLGVVLCNLNKIQEALDTFERAIALDPTNLQTLNNRGNALATVSQFDAALTNFDRALEIQPSFYDAYINRSRVLFQLGRYEEALAGYDQALMSSPLSADAHNIRGAVLYKLRRMEEAIANYDRALTLKPDFAEAWFNRGNVLSELQKYVEAAQSYKRLLEIAPNYKFAKGKLLHMKMMCCDWDNFISLAKSIEEDIQERKKSTEPFEYQAIAKSAQELKLCAEIYAADQYPRPQTTLWQGERFNNSKIRIGYVSGEFRNQVTSILMAGLFEHHDKNRFELFAFDNGWDDRSDIRVRINKAFDNIVDISRLDDLRAATLIKQKQIDILVNLNGYFGKHRTGIFSYKPSPVQVSYLGFSGTMGTDCIDYIIADRYIIPTGNQAFYTEQIVYLPDTYQVSDSRRGAIIRTPKRAEFQLPDKGFIFCCFNNSFKITPEIFDIWMRLLKKVEGSILWLAETHPSVSRNLGIEAKRRDIAPERLLFTPKAKEYSEYLAKYRLADLFLDTFPFNAGATANDTLWAGLPLVTCSGQPYTARMAGSLLKSIGLPELITESLEEYEALALRLARDPISLKSYKTKLEHNRDFYPLFDTERFTRHIETAYTIMSERYRRGDSPKSFVVEGVA